MFRTTRSGEDSFHLVMVGYDDKDAAERALIHHWHAREHHALSLDNACIVRRDGEGRITYRSMHDATPRTMDYYGGALGFALACLLVVPLFFDDDMLATGPFSPAYGEGCRDVLGEALPPNTSAAIFVVRGAVLDRAMSEAKLLDGKAASLDLEPASARRFVAALERESAHLVRP